MLESNSTAFKSGVSYMTLFPETTFNDVKDDDARSSIGPAAFFQQLMKLVELVDAEDPKLKLESRRQDLKDLKLSEKNARDELPVLRAVVNLLLSRSKDSVNVTEIWQEVKGKNPIWNKLKKVAKNNFLPFDYNHTKLQHLLEAYGISRRELVQMISPIIHSPKPATILTEQQVLAELGLSPSDQEALKKTSELSDKEVAPQDLVNLGYTEDDIIALVYAGYGPSETDSLKQLFINRDSETDPLQYQSLDHPFKNGNEQRASRLRAVLILARGTGWDLITTGRVLSVLFTKDNPLIDLTQLACLSFLARHWSQKPLTLVLEYTTAKQVEFKSEEPSTLDLGYLTSISNYLKVSPLLFYSYRQAFQLQQPLSLGDLYHTARFQELLKSVGGTLEHALSMLLLARKILTSDQLNDSGSDPLDKWVEDLLKKLEETKEKFDHSDLLGKRIFEILKRGRLAAGTTLAETTHVKQLKEYLSQSNEESLQHLGAKIKRSHFSWHDMKHLIKLLEGAEACKDELFHQFIHELSVFSGTDENKNTAFFNGQLRQKAAPDWKDLLYKLNIDRKTIVNCLPVLGMLQGEELSLSTAWLAGRANVLVYDETAGKPNFHVLATLAKARWIFDQLEDPQQETLKEHLDKQHFPEGRQTIINRYLDIFQWKKEDIEKLISTNKPEVSNILDLLDLLYVVMESMRSCADLSLSVPDGLKIVQGLEPGAWPRQLSRDAQLKQEGELLAQARDVLLPFVMDELSQSYKDLTSPDRISDFLLIDVQVTGGIRITPIAQAMHTVQTYLMRCKSGSEKATHNIPMDNWAWINDFRLWQADQKLENYPDRYQVPGMHDHQTELFEAFKEELQQGTTAVEAEAAMEHYLSEWLTFSNLEIVDGCLYPLPNRTKGQEENTLVLLARTNTAEQEYYYATATQDHATAALSWQTWKKVNCKVTGETVNSVVFNQMLFLFWYELTEKEKDKKTIYHYTIKYTYLDAAGEWAEPHEFTNLNSDTSIYDHSKRSQISLVPLFFQEVPLLAIILYKKVNNGTKEFQYFSFMDTEFCNEDILSIQKLTWKDETNIKTVIRSESSFSEPNRFIRNNCLNIYYLPRQGNESEWLKYNQNAFQSPGHFELEESSTENTGSITYINEISIQDKTEILFKDRVKTSVQVIAKVRRSLLADGVRSTIADHGLWDSLKVLSREEPNQLALSAIQALPGPNEGSVGHGLPDTYIRELLRHGPLLIARHLQQQLLFEQAHAWHKLVFDPQKLSPKRTLNGNFDVVEWFSDLKESFTLLSKLHENDLFLGYLSSYTNNLVYIDEEIAHARLLQLGKDIFLLYLKIGDKKNLYYQHVADPLNEKVLSLFTPLQSLKGLTAESSCFFRIGQDWFWKENSEFIKSVPEVFSRENTLADDEAIYLHEFSLDCLTLSVFKNDGTLKSKQYDNFSAHVRDESIVSLEKSYLILGRQYIFFKGKHEGLKGQHGDVPVKTIVNLFIAKEIELDTSDTTRGNLKSSANYFSFKLIQYPESFGFLYYNRLGNSHWVDSKKSFEHSPLKLDLGHIPSDSISVSNRELVYWFSNSKEHLVQFNREKLVTIEIGLRESPVFQELCCDFQPIGYLYSDEGSLFQLTVNEDDFKSSKEVKIGSIIPGSEKAAQIVQIAEEYFLFVQSDTEQIYVRIWDTNSANWREHLEFSGNRFSLNKSDKTYYLSYVNSQGYYCFRSSLNGFLSVSHFWIKRAANDLNASVFYASHMMIRKEGQEPDVMILHAPKEVDPYLVRSYIQRVLAWGDHAFRQATWEQLSLAVQLYGEVVQLLGKAPVTQLIPDDEKCHGAQHTTTLPSDVQLQALWTTVEDRLFKIRHGLDINGQALSLAAFGRPIDPKQLLVARQKGGNAADSSSKLLLQLSPYRFQTWLPIAKGMIEMVVSLGQQLLSALQQKDAEGLQRLQATHQINVEQFVVQAMTAQHEEAQQQLKVVEEKEKLLTFQRDHYQALQQELLGLNPMEALNLELQQGSAILQFGAAALSTAAVPLHLLPKIFGTSNGGSDPGAALQSAASAASATSAFLQQGASIASTIAGYQRRAEEWKFQEESLQMQLDQLEPELAAARQQVEIANINQKLHQLTLDQQEEVLRFQKDKFTNADLYQWLAGRLSSLYFSAYELAQGAVKRLEEAYNFELVQEKTDFVPAKVWDSLHKGLLAGESLKLATARIEEAYLQKNSRKREIEKIFSVKALLKEKEGTWNNFVKNGKIAFSIPQDKLSKATKLTIARVSVSIPAVLGPYQTFDATLTQIENKLNDKGHSHGQPGQSVTISRGIDDMGVFQFNAEDGRYLPFEGTGAVSRWEFSVKQEIAEKISDIIFTMYIYAS